MTALNQTYFVYILTDNDNSRMYTGYTGDLAARLQKHRDGTASKFTRKYRTTRLVYYETYPSRKEAVQREKEIKAYNTNRKRTIISKVNPDWRDIPCPVK